RWRDPAGSAPQVPYGLRRRPLAVGRRDRCALAQGVPLRERARSRAHRGTADRGNPPRGEGDAHRGAPAARARAADLPRAAPRTETPDHPLSLNRSISLTEVEVGPRSPANWDQPLPQLQASLTEASGRSWSSGPRLGPDWDPASRHPYGPIFEPSASVIT